jgi:hypothetical protein
LKYAIGLFLAEVANAQQSNINVPNDMTWQAVMHETKTNSARSWQAFVFALASRHSTGNKGNEEVRNGSVSHSSLFCKVCRISIVDAFDAYYVGKSRVSFLSTSSFRQN